VGEKLQDSGLGTGLKLEADTGINLEDKRHRAFVAGMPSIISEERTARSRNVSVSSIPSRQAARESAHWAARGVFHPDAAQ